MTALNYVDFVIPIFIDHSDRIRNFNICLQYLKRIGCNNIFINEHYKDSPKLKNINAPYLSKDITQDDFYNKMVCGNEVFKKFSNNKIICLYDIDVLIPKKALIECAEKILCKDYDFGYPYNGYFYDIPENKVHELQTNLETNISLNECKLFSDRSHGGCVMFDRECFVNGGMLNPMFKNVGFDDDEINVRYSRLGYKKYRTRNPLLHMTHFRGETTFNFSKYVNYNGEICHKMTYMPLDELKKYIKTWNPYANC